MSLRRLTDADWPALAAFGDRWFGQSHSRDRRLNEHWFKPGGGTEWNGVVLDDGAGGIAGVMMHIVVPGWFEGREASLAWISTTVVDPESRARGAGAQLYLYTYRAFPLVGGMSGNQFSNPINARLAHCQDDMSMKRHAVLLDPARAALLCLPERRDAIARANAAPVGAGPGLSRRFVDAVPDDFSGLWRKVRADLLAATDRSPEFMRWRYVDIPYGDYRLVEFRSAGELVGFAVIRPQPTPAGPACRVVDFVALDSHAAAAWNGVVAAARDLDGVFCDFHVIGSRQDRFLAEAGFARTDAATGLDALPNLLSPVDHRPWTNTFTLGGSLASGATAWRRPEAVYFTKGDSDRDWMTEWDLQGRAS